MEWRLALGLLQRGVVHAGVNNGVGKIDIPAFGLGPPPQSRGERDLRTRVKPWTSLVRSIVSAIKGPGCRNIRS